MNEQQKHEILQTAIKRAEFETKIIIKAMENESFRQALINDPKTVYAQETETLLPDSLSIEIVEEASNKVYLRLPPKSIEAEAEGELSDEALEALAGAGWFVASGKDGGWFLATSR